MFSIQRQITPSTLLTVSYVGNQGHHVLAVASVNLGDPALCLSLPGCGPFGEDTTYTNATGQTIYGTRSGQNSIGPRVGAGENYGENTSDSSVANSNYNALETTLRYQRGGSQFLLSYTYAKSIDQGSNIGEQLNPINPRQSRAISAWDQKHSFVASYTWAVPVEQRISQVQSSDRGLEPLRNYTLRHRLSGHALRQFRQLAAGHPGQWRE